VKKLTAAAVLLLAAFFGYRGYERFAAVHCYERFADAWARERADEALSLTEGETARQAVKERGIRALIDARTMELLHGIRYSEESFERREQGEVALEAKQTIAFDPPGITSALGGAMWMTFHHSTRLRRTGGAWRVVAFEPTFLDMGRLRGR
jgi:hypothetical protein